MKKYLAIILTSVMSLTVVAGNWLPPTPPQKDGLPPADEVYLFNVGTGMFLTKGAEWGTHAALTDDVEQAMTFLTQSTTYGDNIVTLYSAQSSHQRLLFYFYSSQDVYVDYNNNSDSSPYWELLDQGNGTFRISAWYPFSSNQNRDYCLGWNPSAMDTYNYDYYGGNWSYYSTLQTNISCYTLNPSLADTDDYAIDWMWMSSDESGLFSAKKALYNALVAADNDGIDTELAGQYYNGGSTDPEVYNVGVDLLEARRELRLVIQKAEKKGIDASAAKAVYNNPNSSADELRAAISLIGADFTWAVPTYDIEDGMPPTYQQILLYNVGEEKFLTKGITWNTHAGLTDNFDEAFIYYIYNSGSNGYRLYSPNANASSQRYLFYASTGTDVYTDYGANSQSYFYPYWQITEQSDGCVRFSVHPNYEAYSVYPDYCLGWDPSAQDEYNNDTWYSTYVGNYPTTNIDLYILDPSQAESNGYAIDWKWVNYGLYSVRKQLYEALLQADNDGIDTELAGHYYKTGTSVDDFYYGLDILNARRELLAAIHKAQSEGIDVSAALEVYNNSNSGVGELHNAIGLLGNYTSYITNPHFEDTVSPWRVSFSYANPDNMGYQNAMYSNGDVTIAQFAEAWRDTNAGSLGEGYIKQTINDLPSGVYSLEADIIAVRQNSSETVTGVSLFANNGFLFEESVHTGNNAPEHFACTFVHEGGSVTIGLQSTAETNANWVAIDNVLLSRSGDAVSPANSVTVYGGPLTMEIGEVAQLTATVMDSGIYNHVLWSSSDVNVATVDMYGNVTGIADGKATIYARAICSDKVGSATVMVGSVVEYDVTDIWVENPDFSNGSTSPWSYYFRYGQNQGYQGTSYSNGDVAISSFIEAWRPSGYNNSLGEGSIRQYLYNLPAGSYTLEADIIAANQYSGGPQVAGVYLKALPDNGVESEYKTEVATGNERPQHFSCDFEHDGGNVTIGLFTENSTTANWVAMDNIRLVCRTPNPATAVDIDGGPLNLVVGEETTLTASVTTPVQYFDRVMWWSDNTAVVDIDANGHIVAKANGTANIYARAICSKVQSSVTVTVADTDPSDLVINEIQVANIDQFMDPSFNYGGWMEIYNPGATSVSLGNLYVSDDPNELTKFQLPYDAGAVTAGGYATIWFDHHDERGGTEFSDEAYKQVPFKLEYEGGTVYLSNSEGELITSMYYPAAVQRCSYARTTDGGDVWQMTSTPTPAASNNGSSFADIQLAAPAVDKDACLFTSPFTFHVAIPSGATLRYTTDGSTPTLTNGTSTTNGTFDVGYSNAVYRFRLFQDGYLPSPVVTRTYIYKNREYYLPIVSVVTDDANLYSDEYGAWVRGGSNGVTGNGIKYESNTNRAWERPVNFEYLVPDADGGSFLMALNQECDFEVCGGWTRNLYSPASSFRLKGGKYYLGQNFLPYAFFENKPYIKNKTIMVRNGGNDGYGRIMDAGIHEIVLRSGFYMDCQSTQPAHVFVNGQYKFMFNIREPNNKNHGYSNYGIDTDYMDQFELNSDSGYQQKVGDFEVFQRWIDLAQQLSDDPTNDAIYQQICDIVDIDEFCNFMAAGCYAGCSDWLTNSNNVKGYRSRQDGKFHLVFMDMDAGFNNSDMLGSLINLRNKNDDRYPYNNKSYVINIFVNMLDYEPFRKKFIDAYCIVDGSVFEPNFSEQVFNDMVSRAYNAMAMEGNQNTMTNSANDMVSRIRSGRSSRMSSLQNNLGLGNVKNIKFSANTDDAAFTINGQPVPRATFDGQLFAPATIKAQAPAGYRFVGWAQQGGETVVSGEGTTIFRVAGEEWNYYSGPYISDLNGDDWKTNPNLSWWTRDAISPFGYGNIGYETGGAIDYNTPLSYGGDSNKKYPTYYFLKSFDINGTPSADKVYRLTFYVDDGCVVYVNGNEVGRYHVTPNPSYYDYFTGSDVYEGNLAKAVTVDIPVEYLHSGVNYIAADVHNNTGRSSDIYWSATLVCYDKSASSYVSTSPELDIATIGSGLTLTATFECLPDADLMANLAMPVRVNEVSAANSVFVNDLFKKNDWVELYNNTDTDIDAAGLYISDDIDDPLKYQIPSGTVANTIIPAHGHLILWADNLEAVTQLHTPFKLENSNGSMLLITSSDEFVANNNAFFTTHPTLKDFADGLIYSMHRGDQSVGRYPDGGNDFYKMNLATIEKTNTLLSFDESLGTDNGIMENVSRTAVFDLAQGWNWVSHPLIEPISVNKFKDKANVIQSQTLEAYYSSSTNGMDGLLRQLEAGQLYKIEMNADKKYEFDGTVPSTPQPTVLREGWNWIGYAGTSPQTVDEAFAGQDVEVGDIIEGQGGFSEYTADNGWTGTLSSLQPGYGYMYKSASAKAVRMKAKSSTLRLRRAAGRVGKGRFGVDRHAYPNVMGVIATLELNGSAVDADGVTVVAYNKGECRGYGQAVDGCIFLTLYGQGAEPLTLKAVADDGTEFTIVESFDFVADVKGSMKAPVVLHLGEPTTTDIAAVPESVRHNAVTPVGYYSLSGSFLGNNTSALRPGIYVVRMSDATSRKLLIK